MLNFKSILFKVLAWFTAVVISRLILEGYSQKLQILNWKQWIFFGAHSYLFYLASFLGLALILSYSSREDMLESASFTFRFLAPLILLPPILDLAVTGGRGAAMSYLLPDVPDGPILGMLWAFIKFALTGPLGIFFGLSGGMNQPALEVNYGIRIELIVILLLVIWWVFLKTKDILRSIGAYFWVLGGIWIMGAFPYVLSTASRVSIGKFIWAEHSVFRLGGTYGPNQTLLPFYFILIVFQLLLIAYRSSPEKFKTVFKNARPNSLIANGLMLNAGVVFVLSQKAVVYRFQPYDFALWITANLSVLFSWLWAVSENDIADFNGDRIAMPERPLPRGTLSFGEMKSAGNIFFLLSLLSAFIVNKIFLGLTAIRMILGIIYNEKPLRLKRLPLISNFVLALAFLSRFLCGYAILSPFSFRDLPLRLLLAILVLYTFATEFKDVKDYAGDLADGIQTLPVLFGEKAGRQWIGALGLIGFIAAALIYGKHPWFLLPLGLLGGWIYYYCVTRVDYKKWPLLF